MQEIKFSILRYDSHDIVTASGTVSGGDCGIMWMSSEYSYKAISGSELDAGSGNVLKTKFRQNYVNYENAGDSYGNDVFTIGTYYHYNTEYLNSEENYDYDDDDNEVMVGYSMQNAYWYICTDSSHHYN